MAGIERVTVTLSDDLVRDIDRGEKNRSKFGRAEGTERRRRDELGRSLRHPHPEIWRSGLVDCPRRPPMHLLTAVQASRSGGSPR